jgi:two-component system phosphate regulon response regulator OmpR
MTDMKSPTKRRAQRILVVDDDASTRELLKRYLAQEGYVVYLAEDGVAMQRVMSKEAPDLILLDLILPGEDGLSLCRHLRESGDNTPIIMLTAKSSEVDRIVGLEVGADDYITKPFHLREVLARVHAVLRRSPVVETPAAPAPEPETIHFGDFSFDLAHRSLARDGQAIPLTSGEFAMLKVLVRHPRQPMSRERLAQLARGRDFGPYDRSLDVQISRLRKMLEHDPAHPRYIQTIWGVGYVFVPDDVH